MLQVQAVKKDPVRIKSQQLLKRDSRSTLYQKIGLVQRKKNKTAVIKDESEDDISLKSDEITFDSGDNIQKLQEEPDFFRVVFALSGDLPIENISQQILSLRNPVFVILSACMEKSLLPGVSSHIIPWISTITAIQPNIGENFQPNDFIFEAIFDNPSWSLILLQVFYLFEDETSPYHSFLQSIEGLFEQCNFDYALSEMSGFLQSISDSPPVCCLDRAEAFAWICVKNILIHCSSPYKIFQFLQILHATKFSQFLPSSSVAFSDIGLLSQLQECLLPTQIRVPYSELVKASCKEEFLQIWQEIVKQLLIKKEDEVVISIEELAHLTPLPRILFQQSENFKELQVTSKWKKNPQFRLDYWLNCKKKFELNYMPVDDFTEFFKMCANYAESQSEKYFLLRFAVENWKTQIRDTADEKQFIELEREMWSHRVEAEMQFETVCEEGNVFLTNPDMTSCKSLRLKTKKEILKEAKLSSSLKQNLECTAPNTTIQKIIGAELDELRIIEACRLAALFQVENRDLSLILTCMDLAEGNLSPEEVEVTPTKPKLLHPVTRGLDEKSTGINVIADKLEGLEENCIHGKKYSSLIIAYYKVTILLNMDYNVIVQEDVFSLAKLLLPKKNLGINLAKELFENSFTSDEQIAIFVATEILNSLHEFIKSEIGFTDDIVPDTSVISNELKGFTRLVKDPSLVGNKLLFQSEDKMVNMNDKELLIIQVELCILAHHCFSCNCNTEGIAHVLTRSQRLIYSMDVANFPLMVHLFNGISRYSEMSYVFDLLIETHQFELLLKKGMEKLYFLKISLLDYLSRCRQKDTDLFMMSALHFCLYREIGDMLLHTVEHKLEVAVRNGLSLSSLSELENAMQFLTEAEESYTKAECHNIAQKCRCKAELVALQIFMLPSEKRIIKLSGEELEKFVVNHPVFSEVYLVSRAYETNVNWAAAVYNNVIVKKNKKYLDQFNACIGVTDNLVEELANRSQKDKTNTVNMRKQMLEVLHLTDNVILQYKISSQLNLQEEITELMNIPEAILIQDGLRKGFSTFL